MNGFNHENWGLEAFLPVVNKVGAACGFGEPKKLRFDETLNEMPNVTPELDPSCETPTLKPAKPNRREVWAPEPRRGTPCSPGQTFVDLPKADEENLANQGSTEQNMWQKLQEQTGLATFTDYINKSDLDLNSLSLAGGASTLRQAEHTFAHNQFSAESTAIVKNNRKRTEKTKSLEIRISKDLGQFEEFFEGTDRNGE